MCAFKFTKKIHIQYAYSYSQSLYILNLKKKKHCCTALMAKESLKVQPDIQKKKKMKKHTEKKKETHIETRTFIIYIWNPGENESCLRNKFKKITTTANKIKL